MTTMLNNAGAAEAGIPARLAEAIRKAAPHGIVTIAYSGGLDSRFLAFAAKKLGFTVRLLHVSGPHISPAETEEARQGAEELGLSVTVIPMNPLDLPDVAAAGRARCYACKKGLFSELLRRTEGEPLCDGTNHSDLGVYRPGMQALLELGIHSPLAEADISKTEIRRLGAALGLMRPDQAARPCLLTRFPYGLLPKPEALRLAADLEKAVSDDPLGARLAFRLRFPDGVKPVLHIETSSRDGITDNELDALCARLKARFLPAFPVVAELQWVSMTKLSGFFDRT